MVNNSVLGQDQNSGSGSMWIGIEIAPLDPDPYWEYADPDPGQPKWFPKRGKIRYFKLKRAEILMVFT